MNILLRLFALGALVLLAHCAAPDDHGDKARVSVRSLALDAQPLVSAEFLVDPDPVRELSPTAPLLDVAASSDEYLLTYAINGLTFLRWNAASGSASTLATLTGGLVSAARAVAVGSGWLVVYQQGTRYAVTVAADGTLGTPLPVPGSCQGGIVGLARSPSTALLTDACGVGVLLDLAGQVLLTFNVVPPYDPQNPFQLPVGWRGPLTGGQVAFNGIDYVCLYGYSGSPFTKAVGATPVSPSGVVAPATFISPAVPYKGVNPLGITANGSTFLLLLRQDRSSGPESNIVYKLMQESPSHEFTLGPDVRLVEQPPSTLEKGDRHATAFTLGARFGIVREAPDAALSLLLVDPANLNPTTTQPLLAPFAGAPVALTAASTSGFVVSAGSRGVRFDSAVQAIDLPAATLIALLAPAAQQYTPSFAFGAGHYLAGWAEPGSDLFTKLFVRRLSSTGAPMGPVEQLLNPDPLYARSMALSADSKGFVSAWAFGPTIGGARISFDPFIVTPFPPVSSAHNNHFRIGSDGERAYLVWEAAELSIARFSDTGTWSPSVTIADTKARPALSPTLAFNAGQPVVFWQAYSDLPNELLIYGMRLNQTLGPIDSSPKEILRIPGSYPGGVQVITAGDHFVMTWSVPDDNGQNSGAAKVYAARLSNTLDLLDPSGIPIVAPPGAGAPALRWDGSIFWLLWSFAEGLYPNTKYGLKGQRFSAALAPIDPSPWLITDNLDYQSGASMTAGAGDTSLIGYAAWDGAFGNVRGRARFISASPFADGVPCDSASQCRNGACSAGHCTTSSGAAGAGGQTGGGIAGGTGSGGEVASGGRGGFETGGYGGSFSIAGNGGAFAGGAGLSNEAGQSAVAGFTSGGGGATNAAGGGSQAAAGEDNGGAVASGGAAASGGDAGSVASGDAGNAASGDAGSAAGGDAAGGTAGSSGAAASGGAISSGAAAGSGAAGESGDQGCSCSAVGPRSPRAQLGGLLLLASALTLVGRRRRRRPVAR